MKTAITTVIDNIHSRTKSDQDKPILWHFKKAVDDLEKMIPVEKEHLEQFHMFGQKSAGIDSSYSDAQNKFTKTYEQ